MRLAFAGARDMLVWACIEGFALVSEILEKSRIWLL